MAGIIDITNWHQKPWYSTGGTRSKKYVQRPDGKYYYFKKSYKTQGRDYFFEFWSEVVATEVGEMLGLKILKYVAAVDNGEMGCLSESMINSDGEELVEGGKYLQAHANEFAPDIRATRKLYSFQLIEEALEHFELHDYIDKVIELIVFDSLIGNSDRHQENWAFINEITFFSGGIIEMERAVKRGEMNKLPKGVKNYFELLFDFDKKKMKPHTEMVKLIFQKTKGFAPIYDSGSSLGRELAEKKVNSMLKNETELNAYISRGVSEIHWQNEKLNHFDLIEKLLRSSYSEITENIISGIVERFDSARVLEIINEVDKAVPITLEKYKLPDERKRLMNKLITLRFERLRNL